MSWIDRLPLALLIFVAAWMAVAPITPEPHLLEKIRLLSQGRLTVPLNIFDLLMHTAPLVLLGVRLWRRKSA
jgi:hypothetical protein